MLFLFRNETNRNFDLKKIACNYGLQQQTSRTNYYQLWTNLWFWNLNHYDNVEIYKGKYKLFFYPLHFEPEATLLYFSPKYSEQISTIQDILKYLPTDHILVVKEHPQQPGKLLNKDFFDLKRRNSNLIFINASQDSHKLIKLSHAIITISGTVGWEAAVNKKPVFVLGDVFYDTLQGVTKLDDISKLSYFLKLPELPCVNENDLIDFIAKIINISIKGFPNNRQYHDNKEFIEYLQKAIDNLKH